MIVSFVLAQCLVLDDPAPGWKRITLPGNAPSLAAPDGYQQFRTTEPTSVAADLQTVFRATRTRLGTATFEFSLPREARTLAVRFTRPLYGARIDVVVDGPRGRMVLLDGQRTEGDAVEVPISLPEASRAEVSVHHHLRPTPALSFAEVVASLRPSVSAGFPPQFTHPQSLYVLSTGTPISLCNRPGQALRVELQSISDESVSEARVRTE